MPMDIGIRDEEFAELFEDRFYDYRLVGRAPLFFQLPIFMSCAWEVGEKALN